MTISKKMSAAPNLIRSAEQRKTSHQNHARLHLLRFAVKLVAK